MSNHQIQFQLSCPQAARTGQVCAGKRGFRALGFREGGERERERAQPQGFEVKSNQRVITQAREGMVRRRGNGGHERKKPAAGAERSCGREARGGKRKGEGRAIATGTGG